MSTQRASDASFLKPTFKRSADICLAFAARALLFTLPLRIMSNFGGDFLQSKLGLSLEIRLYTEMVFLLVVGALAWIYAVQLALRKNYGKFVIRLIPASSGDGTPPPSLREGQST
jgi:hypothetical protein